MCMNKRKTALVLSGGGSRGAYQCGVWQALTELGTEIDIVVGVSVGAINGAMVVEGDVIKTANLWRQIETDQIFDVQPDAQLQDFAKEFIMNRGAGSTGLQSMLKEYVDEEQIRRSPVDFGLLTVEFPSMKPHYLWKEDIPEGRLCDYITASASAFPAVKTFDIDGKDFIDGGYEDNLPAAMALEKGADEVIAVYLDAVGRFRPEQFSAIPNLTFIESKWDLGDFLVFKKENAKRILRLGYLDAMKTFGVFDGEYYAFAKGAFDKRTLRQADQAAKTFHLDPLLLYRRDFFLEKLSDAVADAARDADSGLSLSLSELKGASAISKIRELLNLANQKTVTLFIAENLKQRGEESLFLTKYGSKLFKEELRTAKFLLKYQLI